MNEHISPSPQEMVSDFAPQGVKSGYGCADRMLAQVGTIQRQQAPVPETNEVRGANNFLSQFH